MIRLAALLACLAIPAAAACPLGSKSVPHGEIVEILTGNFSETRRNFAIGTGSVIEVFASGAGTFTIIETRPDGKTCIISAGKNWRDAAPVKPGSPA